MMKRWKVGGFSRQVREQACTAKTKAGAGRKKKARRDEKEAPAAAAQAGTTTTCSTTTIAQQDLIIDTTTGARAAAVGEVVQSSIFGTVLAACAGVNEFWIVLEKISEIGKIVCVCKETRQLLQPTETVLPFWSSWVFCFQMHTWKEMNLVMNVKRNDQCRIRNPFLVDPFGKKNSTRCWDLLDVWTYMLEKHGGTVQGYAGALHKYRKHQQIHFRRQVSHLRKFARAVEEQEEHKRKEEEEERRRDEGEEEECRQTLFERE